MSWFVVAVIALLFFLYYLSHTECHSKCKNCQRCTCRTEPKSVGASMSYIEKLLKRKERGLQTATSESEIDVSAARISKSDPADLKSLYTNSLLNLRDSIVDVYPNEKNLPIKSNQFRTYMQLCTEFAIQYLGDTEKLHNVTAALEPGFLMNKLPKKMPEKPEKFSAVLRDLYTNIMPGLTHWQHPRFHAYFPHGCSFADILGEMLVSSIGVVQFSWDSSPAFTELEITMVNWLGEALTLPENFLFNVEAPEDSTGGGAIQPSASDSILIALLAAREKRLAEMVPDKDLDFRDRRAANLAKLVAYASSEAHTSIVKAAKLAMVRLHLVPSNDDYAMDKKGLLYEIQKDVERGLIPFFVHATAGTTAVASFDRFDEIADVAETFDLWMHVDAAYGGCSLICPEFRYLARGIGRCHSINVNLHKLLLSSCTCSILWTRNQEAIHTALTVNGEYLKKTRKEALDFRHYGISLSRRAKALKIWILFRMYGLHNLQDHVRRLTRLQVYLYEMMEKYDKVAVVTNIITLITFRVTYEGKRDIDNELTIALCEFINRSRKMLVTHAKVHDWDIIRICIGNERSDEKDMDETWKILKSLMDEFFKTCCNGKSSKRRVDEDNRYDVGYITDSPQTVDSTESSSSSSSSSLAVNNDDECTGSATTTVTPSTVTIPTTSTNPTDDDCEKFENEQ